VQLNNEGMMHPSENIPLGHDVRLLLGFLNMLLFKDLHGKHFRIALLAD
jgi:hypothetical protein